MMSLPGKKGKKVVDGEQCTCSVTSDTHCRIVQDHSEAVSIHPRVLTNTSFDCWQQNECIKKKGNNNRRGKDRRILEVIGSHDPPSIIMNDTGNTYTVPKICSTQRVAERLIQTKQMQPNVSQLLRTKLSSSNTSANLKKQVSIFRVTRNISGDLLFPHFPSVVYWKSFKEGVEVLIFHTCIFHMISLSI